MACGTDTHACTYKEVGLQGVRRARERLKNSLVRNWGKGFKHAKYKRRQFWIEFNGEKGLMLLTHLVELMHC